MMLVQGEFKWRKATPEAVIRLFEWQHLGAEATNFSADLYRLIAKADGRNRWLLALGFPDYVGAYDEWHASPTEEKFFERYQEALPVKQVELIPKAKQEVVAEDPKP